ncbi:MAG: hypothetical protein MI784_11060, partial [Cytophagales bacterium]|nr:hypothetical protein [Cytophagales bacterium]
MLHSFCPATRREVLQAKVGFEFESSRWRVNKCLAERPSEGMTEEELYASVQYKKGDVIFENPFWSAQVDVDGKRASFLELVTVPFEENPEGYRQLRRSAREMEIFLSYVYQAPCSETSHKKVVPCVAFRGFGEIKNPEACLVLP